MKCNSCATKCVKIKEYPKEWNNSLIQSIQIEDADFTEEIARFHCGQYFARFAKHLQYAIGNDKHFTGHFTFTTYRIARRENVRFHF